MHTYIVIMCYAFDKDSFTAFRYHLHAGRCKSASDQDLFGFGIMDTCSPSWFMGCCLLLCNHAVVPKWGDSSQAVTYSSCCSGPLSVPAGAAPLMQGPLLVKTNRFGVQYWKPSFFSLRCVHTYVCTYCLLMCKYVHTNVLTNTYVHTYEHTYIMDTCIHTVKTGLLTYTAVKMPCSSTTARSAQLCVVYCSVIILLLNACACVL